MKINIVLLLPMIDIYTGERLTQKYCSKEHIIPRRLFLDKIDSNHHLNIAYCDQYVNNIRSDYRFGYFQKHMLQDPTYIPLFSSSNSILAGLINRQKRTFYPYYHANTNLIAQSCIKMLSVYPYLYNYLDQIIESPSLLYLWLKKN